MAVKVKRLVCFSLFRLLLPLALLMACAVRFNAVSFVYLIFLLLSPLLTCPTEVNIKGVTGIYMIIVIIISGLSCLAHGIFHIVLVSIATKDEPYGYAFPNCSSHEKLARQILVERLDGVPVLHILRLVVPDILVLTVSILVFVACYKLLKNMDSDGSQNANLPIVLSKTPKPTLTQLVNFFGEVLVVLFLACCGVIVPSAIAGVYFLSFLYIATWWSCYKSLGWKFAIFRLFLLVYSGLHLCLLHLYQFQFFQETVSPDLLVSRVLGLTSVIETDCTKPWDVIFHDFYNWPLFINPCFVLVLYYILAIETRRWVKKERTAFDEANVSLLHEDRRRSRQGSERQVSPGSKEEQAERLVEAIDVPNYSSMGDQQTRPLDSPSVSAGFEEDPDDEEDGGSGKKDHQQRRRQGQGWKRPFLVSLLVMLMKQSYVLTLIAMMAWSIAYHSWLTFVLLLSACFVWMTPDSRKNCYRISPIIVFYGECLLIIQFIYGMDLEKELPEIVNGLNVREIGLQRFDYPCLQLALQILFTLTFWMTLRQCMRERIPVNKDQESSYAMENVAKPKSKSIRNFLISWFEMRRESVLASVTSGVGISMGFDAADGYDSKTVQHRGQVIWDCLCKYWIFVCAGMLLIISVQDVVIYRIIYMVFFLFFVLSFQFSYRLWRCCMYLFWWILIVYSMIVLIALYTYQFRDTPNFQNYWINMTGLSEEMVQDIGMESFDTKGLFLRLLTPTLFLIVVILQVHYFHKTFLRISDLNIHREIFTQSDGMATTETEGTLTDGESPGPRKSRRIRKRMKAWLSQSWESSVNFWSVFTSFLWRVTEIHIFKVIAFTIMVIMVEEVSAVSAVYIILLGVFLPITGAWTAFSHISLIWTALVLLSKTIYQLKTIDKDYWFSNCTMNMTNMENISVLPQNEHSCLNGSIDNALWVGFTKSENLTKYLGNYIVILLLIVFERVVFYHQAQKYNNPALVRPATGVIFPDVKRKDADKGILNCMKYFANYSFYKFGLEICYITMAVSISIRLDAYSVIYAMILGALLYLGRRGNARVWPMLTIFLAVLVPMQYVLVLGLPVGLCIEYPWDKKTSLSINLERWLYLPDYCYPPDPYDLVGDFFVLLFVCLQWKVFRLESSDPEKLEAYGGGDNHDIISEVEGNQPVPVADFTSEHKKKGRSYLDVAKTAFFSYMNWVTLFVLFLAGVTRINIFGMGYVIAVFCFMWYGQEFLLKPLRSIRKRWRFLIGYNCLVLFLKAALQLLGCVYLSYLNSGQCWLVQLLGLTCMQKNYVPSNNIGLADCQVEKDDTGLKWDVVCLTFLLLQMRIYNSHYFRHLVARNQALHRLASRGAELINSILIQQVREQKEAEKAILASIKKKMEDIKQRESHINKEGIIESEEHFQAIRGGDYYLFEEAGDDYVNKAEDKTKPDSIKYGQLGDEDDDQHADADPMKGDFMKNPEGSFGKSGQNVIHTALDSGMGAAVGKDKEEEEEEDIKIDCDQGGEDGDEEDTGSGNEDTMEDRAFSKAVVFVKFMKRLGESVADWLIFTFNKISKHYRIVAAKLEDEMKLEQNKIKAEHSQLFVIDEREKGLAERSSSLDDTVLVEVATPSPTLLVSPGPQPLARFEDEIDGDVTKKKENFESDKPRMYTLLEATYYVIIARSELVCYFLMILNQMLNCSLLSLPLPLMVFLWGMLSVPRPSKTFWITVITYTEAVVVVKYLFQFGFFFWNDNRVEESPFWPPRIIGIEKRNDYAYADLVLLLTLFIHRSILKKYGLWKDAEEITEFRERDRSYSRSHSPTDKVGEDAPDGDENVNLNVSYQDMSRPNTGGDRVSGIGSATSLMDSDTFSKSSYEEGEQKSEKKGKVELLAKYLHPVRHFYHQLTNPLYNATTDVYAAMFFCDFINFLIIVFGYWAFGPATSTGAGTVASYIKENRIPATFLAMLVIQFVLIVIDRALYLRKNVLGKFIFQIILVAGVHIWMFFLLPYITDRKFSDNAPAQLFYFVKCVYFGLSAYQIRSNYPTRILGNFLTTKYNYLNLFLFQGFLAIPFLLELRLLMDWIWTDTTFAIGSWLQMEDIFANIYVLKCWREAEKKYPTPRGHKKRSLIKYGVGFLLLILLIFIIWFPLVIFSFANTVYLPNPPIEAVIAISLGGYEPVFKMSAGAVGISALTSSEYNDLRQSVITDRNAIGFLSTFEPQDITRINFNGNSASIWAISYPSEQGLIKYLNETKEPEVQFMVTFTRAPTKAKGGETISNEFINKVNSSTGSRLSNMIKNKPDKPVVVPRVFPKYISLANEGRAEAVNQLLNGPYIGFSNISLKLTSNNLSEWWLAQENYFELLIPTIPVNPDIRVKDNLTLYTFNQRVAPETFEFITGYGIIGLYLTFILLIGRILRLSTTGLQETITYKELPYVNNILQLCLDIYLVREMGEFRLEEDLYAKLLFVFRSSETRIKWTRLPRHLVVTAEKKNN